jgi:histone demethylase JARID1
MKIPRDASRPKLEDLNALADEIATLPFQPEEEDVLRAIIDKAQTFRDHIARYCNPLLSTEAEAETQRFYLRKLEGAEVLLSHETNFFRQELHKWCPVAPNAPPILEVSLSTRKPRPTKLQKMLVEYGVDNPDDLPEHAKGKANSLRRKAANAEAAAAAAAAQGSPLQHMPADHAYGGPSLYSHSQTASPGSGGLNGRPGSHDSSTNGKKSDPLNIDSRLHPGFLGAGGPRLLVDHTTSLEERLLQGDDAINLHSEAEKSKALEILGRTDNGRAQAERIWGPDVWNSHGSGSEHRGSMTPADMQDLEKPNEENVNVNEMFKEMTHQEDDDEPKKQEMAMDGPVTAESLESERNGLDALLDGE